MSGDVLYPLNQMKEVLPDIYDSQVKKYEWRKHIPKQINPQLDCLWNDVIFLFAINPITVNSAIINAGLDSLKLSYYKIPLDQLDQTCISVWRKKTKNSEGIRESEFLPFDSTQMDSYNTLSDDSHEYFREMKMTSPKRYLIYLTVPHILYKGTINVNGLEIITL
jgi:hypothetical protein